MHIAVFQVLSPIHDRAASRHRETFASPDDLIANVKAKIHRRSYIGYALIWWSEDFPLLEWMREREYAIDRQDVEPPGIQLDLPWEDDV